MLHSSSLLAILRLLFALVAFQLSFSFPARCHERSLWQCAPSYMVTAIPACHACHIFSRSTVALALTFYVVLIYLLLFSYLLLVVVNSMLLLCRHTSIAAAIAIVIVDIDVVVIFITIILFIFVVLECHCYYTVLQKWGTTELKQCLISLEVFSWCRYKPAKTFLFLSGLLLINILSQGNAV